MLHQSICQPLQRHSLQKIRVTSKGIRLNSLHCRRIYRSQQILRDVYPEDNCSHFRREARHSESKLHSWKNKVAHKVQLFSPQWWPTLLLGKGNRGKGWKEQSVTSPRGQLGTVALGYQLEGGDSCSTSRSAARQTEG